ncbi:hypothetical protein A6A19_08740 [Actinobacillus delphinicola]|uniref:HI1450 family dsDNA-mimic protein n=1 Tax=Actinobacillus delphinicola TaxID=51161 RepID=UPI002441A807|nr:HI1450 family dsDNA-mimic protein [Actinobacillus delphinicola]MDG6898060.1 hypothetical protein [Actinobacillus delphinicola]
MQKMTDEALLDLAYEIFLEMAGENLSAQEIALFNEKFAECGEIALFDTADNWEEEIGVLIDPEQFAEVWIGLTDAEGQMRHVFAKCLINYDQSEPDFHMIW